MIEDRTIKATSAKSTVQASMGLALLFLLRFLAPDLGANGPQDFVHLPHLLCPFRGQLLVSNDESLKKASGFIKVLSSREFVGQEEKGRGRA